MTDLTDKWKKGELPSGEDYIIDDLGLHTSDRYYPSHGFGTELPQSVLGRVPSYEEMQSMNEAVNQAMAANIKLVEQNAQLKELLKECSIANTALVGIMDWLRKATIPEQREDCVKLFEKTQELQKRLDEVLK